MTAQETGCHFNKQDGYLSPLDITDDADSYMDGQTFVDEYAYGDNVRSNWVTIQQTEEGDMFVTTRPMQLNAAPSRVYLYIKE